MSNYYVNVKMNRDDILKIISSNPNLKRIGGLAISEIRFYYVDNNLNYDTIDEKLVFHIWKNKKSQTEVTLYERYRCIFDKELYDEIKNMNKSDLTDQNICDSLISGLLKECN